MQTNDVLSICRFQEEHDKLKIICGPFLGGSGSDTKPRSTPRLYFEGGGSEGPQHSLESKKGHFLENTSLCGGDTDHIRTRPLYTFNFHYSVNSYIYVMLTPGSVAFKM